MIMHPVTPLVSFCLEQICHAASHKKSDTHDEVQVVFYEWLVLQDH